MTAWLCMKCGWDGRTTQKSGHMAYRCPKQGNLMRAIQRQERALANETAEKAAEEARKATTPPAPAHYQYLPCLCQCGEQIGQVKGQKKRQFVNHDHYDAWRRKARAESGNAADLVGERKHAEEVAALESKNAAIARAAQAVRMVTGEASFRLWAECLGFNAGDAVPVAA